MSRGNLRPGGAADSTTSARSAARRWSFAAVWATLALTAGPALADALDSRGHPFRSTASVGLWLIWVATLVAALVPRTVTLTLIRIVAPAAIVAAAWAAAATPSLGADDAVALVATTLAAAVAFAPAVGDEFVNGSSYGHERRLPLRAPAALLIGPIELIWTAVVAGAVAGPLLMAVGAWAAGTVALVLGWTAAWWGARSLHTLARRWLVFTPAGIVVHDQLAVVEAMLVLRNQVASLGPALADSRARDLTQGAPGLALELGTREPVAISPTPRRRWRGQDAVVSQDVTAVLFTPTRPGVVLVEAAARHFPVA
jgi:hypothetical protein